MRAVLAMLAFLAAPAAAEVTPATFERLNAALAEGVALPAYGAYADAAAALPGAVASVCAGEGDVAAARQAFRAMALAWQRAQPIALGPVMAGHGRARIHWWPDERGTGERQLRRLLFQADDTALAPAAIAEASVATTGLSALEWLIFTPALEDDPYACRYAAAVAAWQAGIAADLVAAWPAFADDLEAAEAGGSTVYYDAADAAQAWLKGLLEALDLMVRDKLEAPLGPSHEEARGRRAELHTAALALPSIAANLATVRAMLAVDGGFADALAAAGSAALGQGIVDLADQAIAQADALGLPLEAAVADPAAREDVLVLLRTVEQLRLLASGPLARDLGLIVGFNAADGD